MTDLPPATYDDLDELGRHYVDRYTAEVEGVAVKLESAATAIRRRAEDLSLGSLQRDASRAKSLDDLMPDFIEGAEGVLSEIQGFLGNLWLRSVTRAGHDAHEAYRRAAREKAARQ